MLDRLAWLVPAVVVWILVSAYAQKGTHPSEESNRVLWLERLGLLLLALCAPNPWISGLLVLPLLVWRQEPLVRPQIEPLLLQLYVWAGLYVALAPHVTRAWLPWLLGSVLGVGAIQGAWMLHSLWVGVLPYERPYRVGPWTLTLWEHEPSFQVTAGCGNPNHTQAISAMATAAGIGLLLMGYWAVLPLVSLSAVALGYYLIARDGRYGDGSPTSSAAYVVVLSLSAGPLLAGWIGLGLSLLLALLSLGWLVWRYPTALSGRLPMWASILDRFWRAPWPQQLVGSGSGSWIRSRMQSQTTDAYLWLDPHNEFLMMLWEHGLVGVGVLAGYLLSSAWALATMGASGAAVCLLGAIVVTCAMIQAPWSPYVEVISYDQTRQQFCVTGKGAPGVNVISFVAVLCVEALT